MATRLLYLEDITIISCSALIVSVSEVHGGRLDIVLNQTCFFPHGSMHEGDAGHIINGEDDFVVHEVQIDDDGTVHHVGVTAGTFTEGYEVDCIVDKDRRELIARTYNT